MNRDRAVAGETLRGSICGSYKAAMFEDDFWEAVLRPYASEPGLAFVMAQTFMLLKRTLAKGPDGTQEVMAVMDVGIKELYQYTDFHQACVRLYQHSISPEGLQPQLDPTIIVEQLDKPKTRTKERAKKNRIGRRVRR